MRRQKFFTPPSFVSIFWASKILCKYFFLFFFFFLYFGTESQATAHKRRQGEHGLRGQIQGAAQRLRFRVTLGKAFAPSSYKTLWSALH